ncbi:arylsulfatase A [Rhodopirellula maiorica SM1]|uniref:Arylsulfatase A n=1 Tax=Rhodopirellula maiorica SM1 TaxID=1265738 RepID=M5RR48_9BACT|nr:sulfatase [Rhodopirellula maiorica]EMI21793.1 arylsulfatase A [Rhodopirellula maiorica SM1]
MIDRLAKLLCLSLPMLMTVAHGGAAHSASPKAQPNIIVIFIDDMGYGDVGFNGVTGAKTPSIDQMAAEGMIFDDFYVDCAVCSGSRAALLTGTRYQRLGMRPVLFPDGDVGLNPDEVTIAEVLRDSGYKTACVGKWHLGHLPPCLPTYHGFDSYFGIPYSNDMWIDPANQLASDIVLRQGVTLEDLQAGKKVKNWVPMMRGEEIVEYPANQDTLTKRYTEEAMAFIKDNKAKPFFLYLPHSMVHQPLAASPEFQGRTKTALGDAIEEVDWSVGEIIKTLKEEQLAEKTLVIFTSDNGAALGSSRPLRGKKRSIYDGGMREPTVMWWPGQIPAGTTCTELASSVDLLPTLAGLSGGELPERKIDGKDIWPLMAGLEGAKSPHDTYVFTYGAGAVRSGKWKFYPWSESNTRKDKAAQPRGRAASPLPVQLYDTDADISETKNLAQQYPDVVSRLQSAYDVYLADVNATKRSLAVMTRPDGSLSPARPSIRKKANQGTRKAEAKQDATSANATSANATSTNVTLTNTTLANATGKGNSKEYKSEIAWAEPPVVTPGSVDKCSPFGCGCSFSRARGH